MARAHGFTRPIATMTEKMMNKSSPFFARADAARRAAPMPKADRALGEPQVEEVAAASTTAKPPVQPA